MTHNYNTETICFPVICFASPTSPNVTIPMLPLQPHQTKWPLVHIPWNTATKSKQVLVLYSTVKIIQQVAHFPANLASTLCCLLTLFPLRLSGNSYNL